MLGLILYISSLVFIVYILYRFFHTPLTKLTTRLDGKTVVVTGANTGIGKEAALFLLKRGATVVLAGRDETKTMNVINAITNQQEKQNAIFIKLDVSNLNSIKTFVETVKNRIGKIDILINNAGAITETFGKTSNIENTFMTNHIGPVLLTAMLIDSINLNGRIINVASQAHEFIYQQNVDSYISDLYFDKSYSPYQMFNVYAFSKYSNIVHAEHLNRYLQKQGKNIKAVSLHPGAVFTDFATRMKQPLLKFAAMALTPIMMLFFKTPFEGAQTTLETALLEYENLSGGSYYNNCEVQSSTLIAKNQDNRNKVMLFTKKIIESNFVDLPKEVTQYLNSIN